MEEDALFDVSLKSFVEARKALAASLRVAKRADVVKRVLAMPKPTPSAWALNQVARKDAQLLVAYLEAHDAQAAAQVQGAAREHLFATAHAERVAKKALVDRALAALEADGQKISKSVADALPTTLHASAMDPRQRSVLVAGRLLGDVDAADFSTLALLAASQGLTSPSSPVVEPARAVAALAVEGIAASAQAAEVQEDAPHERRERQARAASEKAREEKAREEKAREDAERRSRLAGILDALRRDREEIAVALRAERSELASARAALAAAELRVATSERAVLEREAALLAAEAACDDAAEALARSG